jgi:hypothetical protein
VDGDMHNPGPPLSERRFLLYLAIAAVFAVIVVVVIVFGFDHAPVPK